MKKKICKKCGRQFKCSKKHIIYCSVKCNKQGQIDVRHNWYLRHIDVIKERRNKNPNTARTQRKAILKKKYNMTFEDYTQLCKKQNSQCAICKQSVKLHVDHNHKTGKIRGLLCTRCNLTLGLLKDDIKILQSAIKYLKRK